MKISDFQNEDALDLLAAIIDPAAEIMNDAKVVKIAREKPLIFAVKEILKNHKKAAIEIVAAMHGKDPGEIRFNALSLTKDVLEIMDDPEIQAVFTYAGQNTDNASSGSATVSTGASER